jgi:hypothetical protein
MNNASSTQDIERAPTQESADIEQEQGYTESEPGLGRVNNAGEVNEQQPGWRPGEKAAGESARYAGEVEPARGETDNTGDDDDILSSRGQSSGGGGL